jgi:hypothetical protein
MSHLAVPRILIGAVAPWREPTHGELADGTLWLDTVSWTLRARTVDHPEDGQEIGASPAVVQAILQPLLDRLTAAEASIAALQAQVAALKPPTGL